jgi:hypothetical protein
LRMKNPLNNSKTSAAPSLHTHSDPLRMSTGTDPGEQSLG